MGRKIRRMIANGITAIGIFLFFSVIFILLLSRKEFFEFIKNVYLSGTWKVFAISAIPTGITCIWVVKAYQ